MSDEQPGGDANPLQGYYEWQVTTLMLAYDLVEPIPPGDDAAADQRRERINEELSKMVHELLPQEYVENPDLDFPPEIMMAITRATLRRATEIVGL